MEWSFFCWTAFVIDCLLLIGWLRIFWLVEPRIEFNRQLDTSVFLRKKTDQSLDNLNMQAKVPERMASNWKLLSQKLLWFWWINTWILNESKAFDKSARAQNAKFNSRTAPWRCNRYDHGIKIRYRTYHTICCGITKTWCFETKRKKWSISMLLSRYRIRNEYFM